jgi:glycosyltransferase involved in cell wall biosynthesis
LEHYKQLGYDRFNNHVNIISNGLSPPYPRLYRRERTGNLGYCGRLVPRKRPEYVQMILGEKRFDSFNTLLAGKGFSIYSKNLLKQLNLENRVLYLGWCAGARLDSFYNNIDVLCAPSVYEPFGMVALEAASRRIPVVCSDIDGLRDVLGSYAIYCKPGNYDDFKEACIGGWTSTPLWNR